MRGWLGISARFDVSFVRFQMVVTTLLPTDALEHDLVFNGWRLSSRGASSGGAFTSLHFAFCFLSIDAEDDMDNSISDIKHAVYTLREDHNDVFVAIDKIELLPIGEMSVGTYKKTYLKTSFESSVA